MREDLEAWMAGRADATIRKMKSSLTLLVGVVGDLEVVDCTRAVLTEFRAARIKAVRPATVNRDMRNIKSALSYAVDAGWIEANPAWRWRGCLIREAEREIRVVSNGEFSQLVESTDLEFGTFISLCYFLGLRRGEACRLRWDAISFGANLVKILNRPDAGEYTKSRRNRSVPMREVARRMLWRLHKTRAALRHDLRGYLFTNREGKPWNVDVAGARFAKLVDHVAISKCTLHDLRRSFSTLAQRAGVDVGTVQLLGGWASIGVVRRHYTGDLHGHLASTMSMLDQQFKETQYHDEGIETTN